MKIPSFNEDYHKLQKNVIYHHYNPKNYKIIPPQQIDIYIPSLNIAIEINGEYHHSIILKEEQYHMNKWRKCYDKNIELISLWGDWFKNTKDVENFLYNLIFYTIYIKIY